MADKLPAGASAHDDGELPCMGLPRLVRSVQLPMRVRACVRACVRMRATDKHALSAALTWEAAIREGPAPVTSLVHLAVCILLCPPRRW